MTKFMTVLFAGIFCVNANAASNDTMLSKLKTLYPNTSFAAVQDTPLKNIYEVHMGKNVAYTDDSARYFLFGHLYDMKTQSDLTGAPETVKSYWPKDKLNNAIVTVKGNGSRKLAVFSDPDCPYCKRLEANLQKLDNVTIYTFLFPLDSLHPAAKGKAISIWCATDRVKAYDDYMLKGIEPEIKSCANPIDANLELGARLGVQGTPTLIGIDGTALPGAASSEEIEKWFNSQKQ